ncbi:MAG: hypothetical protein PHI11_10525 [Gallionella sp.]|nr:hypothetical protein [Gallionella sp.]
MYAKTRLKIRVMAEYGSSGIWGFSEKRDGDWRHVEVEHREGEDGLLPAVTID